MSTPSFGAILDKPAGEVERPKPLPVGSYICVIQGLPRQDKSSKKQTEFVEFACKILSPGEDVDADELEAAGGWQNKVLKATYYLTEDALWRLKKFLVTDLQIDDEGGDASFKNMIAQAPGRQLIVHLKHEASEDGTQVFHRVRDTAPVGE